MKKLWILISCLSIIGLAGCNQQISIESGKGIGSGSVVMSGDIQEISPDIEIEDQDKKYSNNGKDLSSNPLENWRNISEEELATYLPECSFEKLAPAKIFKIDNVIQNCKKEEKKGYLGIAGAIPNDGASFFQITKNGDILEPLNDMQIDNKYFNIVCKVSHGRYGVLILGKQDSPEILDITNKIGKILQRKDIYLKYMNTINQTIDKQAIKSFCAEDCEDFKFTVALEKNNHYIIGGLRREDGSNDLFWGNDFSYLVDNVLYSAGKDKYEYVDAYNTVFYIKKSRWYFSNFSGDTVIMKRITNTTPLIQGEIGDDEYSQYLAPDTGKKGKPFTQYTLETCEIPL